MMFERFSNILSDVLLRILNVVYVLKKNNSKAKYSKRPVDIRICIIKQNKT